MSKEAVEKLAERLTRNTNKTSEQAHRHAIKIAQRNEKKNEK